MGDDRYGASVDEEDITSVYSGIHGYVQEPSRPETRLDPRLTIWWPTGTKHGVYVHQDQSGARRPAGRSSFSIDSEPGVYYQQQNTTIPLQRSLKRPATCLVSRSARLYPQSISHSQQQSAASQRYRSSPVDVRPSPYLKRPPPNRIYSTPALSLITPGQPDSHSYAYKNPVYKKPTYYTATSNGRAVPSLDILRNDDGPYAPQPSKPIVVNSRSLRFSESSGLRLRTSYGSGTSVSAEEARTSFGAYVGSARSEEPLSTLRTSETPIEYRAVSSGTGPTDSFWQNADPATYSDRPLLRVTPVVPKQRPPMPSKWVLALVCAPVSKDWHKWINELSDVWHEIDLNGKQNMSSLEWKSVADKRPKLLNLGWTGIGKEELRGLLEGDSGLERLCMTGCHFSAVTALSSCSSDLVVLDLRWVQGCNDSSFKGLVLNAPCLKSLNSLFVSGCDITDATVRLIANQFGRLKSLDLSHCTRITNLCVEVMGAAGSVLRRNLTTLNMSDCRLLTADIFGPLQRMQALGCLEIRDCPSIADYEIYQFERAYEVAGKSISVAR